MRTEKAILLMGLVLLSVPRAFAAPEIVSVDGGRQLFVDDRLIASTNGVVRHWPEPVKMERPLIRPTSETKGRLAGCTVATDGGLWWDPTIRKYRLWYETDWAGQLRYAESADGLAWEMPDLGVVKGTNRVLSDEVNPLGKSLDSWSVWPDYKAKNSYASWKMLVSAPGGITTDTLFSSTDGLRWTNLGVAGYSGDRTTMHFDALLGGWVFSLRDFHPPHGRARRFHVQAECVPADMPYGFDYANLKKPAGTRVPEPWTVFDKMDFGPRGSLYNFDAVPYESLMLGVMEVLHNTPNDNGDSDARGLPKQTSLRFAFSRDGRNYVPAPESALKPSGWGSGRWDTGYLSAMGGICTVDDDRLRFYYSALRGDAELRRAKTGEKPMHLRGIYYNGAIGCATLRRDGFCGLVADGAGEVVTPPLAFTGSHLFVNAECFYGEVAAEIIGTDGRAFTGFAAADCKGLKFTDRTKAELVFSGGSLATLADKNPRIRFKLHCATLYSFWISPSERGESRGYVAAGGPAYPGLRDLPVSPSAGHALGRLAPIGPGYRRADRKFGGIPSVAVSPKNGRLWRTYYAGPTNGEDSNNYVVLSTRTGTNDWQDVLYFDPDGDGPVRSFDPEVWIAPDGKLHWTWTDREVVLRDGDRNRWANSWTAHGEHLRGVTLDAENLPVAPYPAPRTLVKAGGVMMCKPIVARDGSWLYPVAFWNDDFSARIYRSTDGGKTLVPVGGATLPERHREFEEHNIIELKDGTLRVYMRAKCNGAWNAWQADSHDGGRTWDAAKICPFPHPNSRFFVRRLASGALLLVKNGSLVPPTKDFGNREDMMAFVSDDDGSTWKGGLLLHKGPCAYPDGDQAPDGTIHVTFDGDRFKKQELFYVAFTEADVRRGGVLQSRVAPHARAPLPSSP